MNIFNKGDIVWARVPFSDNSGSKWRPVLIINVDKNDFLALFITSTEKQNTIKITIRKTSFIRINRPIFIHKNQLGEKFTTLDSEVYDKIIFEFIKFQAKFSINRKIQIS